MNQMSFGSNEKYYNLLINAYGEKHRGYHDLSHIEACLTLLDEVSHLASNTESLKIAFWFHDAIYKAFSRTNEADSADLAIRFLKENGSSQQFQKTVYNLIMVTEHKSLPSTQDEKIMVDIDLSILGTDSERYALYKKGVRKEYKLVPMFIYRKKRKEILEEFLNRSPIYHIEYFQNKFEVMARRNIEQEIAEL